MSEAYFRGFGLKLAIQDPVAQRILAVGAIGIVAAVVLRKGGFDDLIKLAKGTAEVTKEATLIAKQASFKIIESHV